MPHRAGMVRAVLPSLDAARDVIARLEHEGLDASAVRFDEATRERADGSLASSRSDERLLDRLGERWLVGVVAGLAVGAVAGGIAGAAAFGFEGRTALVAALAFAIGLGAAGAGVGLFAGGVWGQKQSAAWGETFEAPGLREVTLLVDVSDAEEARLAGGVLREYTDRVEEEATGGPGGREG